MTAVSQPSHIAGCVVSVRPTIVVAKRETGFPLGLASLAPERFADAPSLHFIGQTWTWEDAARNEVLLRDIQDAQKMLPNARFVIMANTASECMRLSELGLANVRAHELIFIDERTFTPAAPRERREERYDAIYVARLSSYKRHELAASVDNLLLAYGRADPGDLERTRQLLPNARFANHDKSDAYRYIESKEIRDLMRQSAVGLCLSACEGGMRASMEYRYCGLPVVSTRALGGRDRFLLGPHVRLVDDDAQAVAAAVRDLKAQAFDPFAVREYAGRLVSVDRHGFLSNVNKIVEHVFGIRDHFRSFAPFMHSPGGWRPTAQVLAQLEGVRA